jgi:hypothetical protein
MKEKLNLQSLLVWSNFPGMDQRAVMDSVQRFTEDVIPQFAEENNS